MGDRCYMTMTFGGHIETVEELDQIIKLIEYDDCGQVDHYPQPEIKPYLATCADDGDNPQFYFYEVNYAELDCASKLADLGFDVYAHNDAGGGYDAGHQSWNGETGDTFDWSEASDGRVTIDSARAILTGDGEAAGKVEAVAGLLAAVEANQWVDLRPLTLSDAVKAHCQQQAAA